MIRLGGGRGFAAAFWEPYFLVIERQLVIPFIDARRGHGLTVAGLRVAYSMMHEGLRLADPDIETSELIVLKFAVKEDSDERPLRILRPGALELFSHEQLDTMIGETYRIWEEVLRDRREGPSSGGTGTGGLFG